MPANPKLQGWIPLLMGTASLMGCAGTPPLLKPLVSGSTELEPRIALPQGQRVPASSSGSGILENWQQPGLIAQGFLGLSWFGEIERQDSSSGRVDGSSEDLALLPLGGGGIQRVLAGGQVGYGYEIMLSGSGRNGERLSRATPAGGSAQVNVDLLLLDMHVGPLLSAQLGGGWRLYGSLGPVLQFAQWDETEGGIERNTKGFGLGAYARIGLDYARTESEWIGLSLGWLDTEVDLGAGLGDFEASGVQLVLTLSQVY